MADSLFSSLVGGGLSLYDKAVDRNELPANKRVFLESMLDKNRSDITESKLSKSEQDALKELVWTKYSVLAEPLQKYKDYLEKLTTRKDAKLFYSPDQLEQAKQDLNTVNAYFDGKITPELLKLANLDRGTRAGTANLLREAGVNRKQFNIYPNIQYDDYSSSPGEVMGNFSVFSGSYDPKSAIQTLLGRFNFDVDKQGNLKIKDAYDFNAPASGASKEAIYEAAPVMGPYQMLREYAGEQMPPGQGRNVNISVPLEPLKYRDPFGSTINSTIR
jgi:hypothetical protein